MLRCFFTLRADGLDRPLDILCMCVDAIEIPGGPLTGRGVKVAAVRRTP